MPRADVLEMGDTIRLRYGSACGTCTTPLPAGTRARYDRPTKTATCLVCIHAARTATGPGAAAAGAVDDITATEAEGIRLRYGGACTDCGTVLAKGVEAHYDRRAKTVRCVECRSVLAAVPLDVGVAGGSARKVADRQQARRDAKKAAKDQATRDALPLIGGLVVGVRNLLAEPEKPTPWQKGAAGEEHVGRTFAGLSDEGFVVLHDRRKPGTRWNIDHVVIGPRGVYVIDAKHYTGRLDVRSTGTIFRPGPNRVYVKGRHQDKRVAGMNWQVGWIRDAAGGLIDEYGGVIRPVLCFIGVEVGWTQGSAFAGADNDVLITWPKLFVKEIDRDGPLTRDQVQAVARHLAEALPAAPVS